MNKIIILTPSYNRANTLPILYKSLIEQTDRDFVWAIIDDGSTDNTKELVNKMIKNDFFQIDYIYQNNGGKARALNRGFTYFDNASIYVIVDSDDYLLPTAIETIKHYLSKYEKDEKIGAFFFHYSTPDGKILKRKKSKIIDKDYIMTRYEYNSTFGKRDGCICYLKRVIKKYRYPEYEGEKYVGPTVIEMEMANEFKIVFSPKVIGVAEYREGGLTHSGRQLRISNPLGMIHYSGLHQSKLCPITTRIKYSVAAQAYRFFSKKDKQTLSYLGLSKYLKKWAYIPGFILKFYWQLKYEKRKI